MFKRIKNPLKRDEVFFGCLRRDIKAVFISNNSVQRKQRWFITEYFAVLISFLYTQSCKNINLKKDFNLLSITRITTLSLNFSSPECLS